MKITRVKLPEYKSLDVHDKLTFLGSCFSEHIARSANEVAFDTLSNPFGVLFNPVVLANTIVWDEEQWLNSIFQSQDKFLSWNASSTIWDLDKQKLVEKLIDLRCELIAHLKSSKTLFVTFGTSWIYEHNSYQNTVANCHKQPQNEFKKRCLYEKEIVSIWNKALTILRNLNSSLKVVFTVSPVRHKKDGLIENNQSKGRLINAVHEIVSNHECAYYFPSYEIVIDELRDYAFFESDGVHPNKYAVQEIEDRFYRCFLSDRASDIIKSFNSIKNLLSHRVLHEGSREANELIQIRDKKRTAFLKEHPGFTDYLK